MPPSTRHAAALTEGPIARSLLLFSLPILGANVLQSLNASVNAIWIGHFLGEAALAAAYYRWGNWRHASMLGGHAQQAASTGLDVPATALDSFESR